MTGRARTAVFLLSLGLPLVACRGTTEATATERLWVAGMPKGIKTPTAAFLATRTKEGKFIGAFFQGSLVRGGYDVFDWQSKGEHGAMIRFLQDGRTHALRFETCTPDRGFDFCLVMHGDPTGVKRYQSRKRWTLRRGRSKKAEDAALELPVIVAETLGREA